MSRIISPDKLSYCTIPVRLFLRETKTELYTGAAFVYEYESKYYLITNWHIITGLNPLTKEPIMKHGGIPDDLSMILLVNTNPLQWNSFTLELYKNNVSDWFIHPVHREMVDVVAIELELPEDFQGIIKPINANKFDGFDLSIADDVFILGYPYSFTGGGYFPIWKRGSVATEPDIDYEGLPKYYIDTATKPGMSGSPVLFRRTGLHNKSGNKLTMDTIFGTIQNFVGVYSGRVTGENDFDAQLGIVWKKDVIEEIIKGRIKDNKNFA
jgi:hypothetical protein